MQHRLNRSERDRSHHLHRSGHSSTVQRRARTKSLIQIGGLCEKAGLLETFGITVGSDLQKDLDMKIPVAAFFKELLDLNDLSKENLHLDLLAQQGLAALAEMKPHPRS